MRLQRILILALPLLALIACGEATDNGPGQPVTHRRAAFKKILLAFEPMGIELREKRYDANQFIDQANALSRLKNEPWSYFGVGTNYPPTRAKEKVWSDPDQFKAAQETFLQAVDHLSLVAEKRDEGLVRTAYEAVQNSCKNCHKSFRQ